MRCGVRPEREIEWSSYGIEIIEHYAWLNSRRVVLSVNLEYLIHVATHIHDHCDVAGLTRQTGASTSAENRCVVASTDVNDALHVPFVQRESNP